jgi:hypothetical protein
MTDSPAVQAPLDPQEAPILDRMLFLREKLSLLKQDKSTYIKSSDVLSLYNEVIEQVHQLNTIRERHGKPLEQNRGLFTFETVHHIGLRLIRLSPSGQRARGLLPIDISLLLNDWSKQRSPCSVSPIQEVLAV